ncbi:DEAD/DEAH box helicase [Candidatus Parcubacteria bacterium]|nr:DEAD/DEAH box helicase [Candidatus Parcubacteria bacterium]
MTTFKELNLNPEIIKSLDDLGFIEPTPIQEKVIPFILKSKKDLIASAQTGTGKTAAFGLPILSQIKANEKDLLAIILCPTRELCIQISRDITKYARHSKGLRVTAVYGGARIDLQIRSLRTGTNIVVGTPGRVHDLIRRKVLKLQNVKWLVLDEADEMLDMGFKKDLDAILEQTPKTRQTLLFSATISKSIQTIAKKYMNEAREINAGEKNVGAEKVSHEYYVVSARDRFEALKRILDCLPGVYGILFCRTRIETGKIADLLKQSKYDAEALHGEISQNIRTKIMDRFKKKQIQLLVATDVAARGIDVSDLTHIINYNLPDNDESYTHRSGRTGRAKKSGISISILTPREVNKIKTLEGIIGKKFEYKKVPEGNDICKKQIDNFLAEIEETNIKDISNDKYLKDFAQRLKKVSKEDLIKLFITQKFKSTLNEYKNTRDLNAELKPTRARKENGDNVNLKINFGKKNGFIVKDLFALLNSNKNLKGVEVGRINIMPEHSIFSVERRRADAVVKYLNGTNLKNKKIIINKSDIAAGYQGKRRNKSNRNFKRKNKGRKRY